MFRLHLLAHGLVAFASGCIDFSDYSAGDVVSDLGSGIRVEAYIKPRKFHKDLFFAPAMIFNTSMPTGDDFDLGSPNQDFGGPGIGAGGGKDAIFQNKIPRGNVVIISENKDGSNDPDDSKFGGRIKFYFDPPRYIASFGLLDAESVVRVNVFTQGNLVPMQILKPGRGDNSFQRVHIGIQQVRKLTVIFQESGAVTDVDCNDEDDSLPSTCDTTDIAVDFEAYKTGQVVTDLGSGITVAAMRHGSKGLKTAAAMIFDSSSPSGGDTDLGTPHESAGGPGVGIGGEAGTPFENAMALGKVLIISEDDDSSDPDDAASGGVLTFHFTTPAGGTYVNHFGILDNEEGAHVIITMADGSTTEMEIPGRSDNSFAMIQVQLPDVVMMSIDFAGSAALTHLDITTCA